MFRAWPAHDFQVIKIVDCGGLTSENVSGILTTKNNNWQIKVNTNTGTIESWEVNLSVDFNCL